MYNIKIKYDGKDKATIEDIASKIVNDLSMTLGFDKSPDIEIRVHNSRESYNKKLNKQSESWEVGNASLDGVIDIFHPEALEKYSTHDSGEFDSILKHEIVHVFIRALAKDTYIPYWLNEGLANFLSDEADKKQNSPFFIEDNFTSKLSSGKDWNNSVSDGAYEIARLFIRYLIKHFSLNKVLTLVKDLDTNFYEPAFRNKFSAIFGQNIHDVEAAFIKNLNSR